MTRPNAITPSNSAFLIVLLMVAANSSEPGQNLTAIFIFSSFACRAISSIAGARKSLFQVVVTTRIFLFSMS